MNDQLRESQLIMEFVRGIVGINLSSRHHNISFFDVRSLRETTIISLLTINMDQQFGLLFAKSFLLANTTMETHQRVLTLKKTVMHLLFNVILVLARKNTR